MFISLPLFMGVPYAQASVLVILQLLDIVRVILIRPFHKTWRNIYKIILQSLLCVLFICQLAHSSLLEEIVANNPDTIGTAITHFYRVGWVGFAAVFAYNCLYIVLFVIDFAIGCKYTNIELMTQIRKQYYYHKIKRYET